MKPGRPINYTPKLAEEICGIIASSNKGIKRLCNGRENLPCPSTVYHWLFAHKEFRRQYIHAKQMQIEVLVDEIMQIANDDSLDTVINEDGNAIINHQYVQRSRLQIDIRKWLASKLTPRIYGN
ncbi:MAG: hypothetical protein NTU49_10915 [Gammaproteobacteria bacterium]|nr:hypothetical protein [Gammaproteobacteria bacterium]